MITGENQGFPFLQVHKFLDNIHHTIFLENIFPKIRSRVSIRIRRISFAAIVTGTVRALIKRQKICIFTGQFRCHPNFRVVNAEKCQDPPIKLKTDFTGITVIHPLLLCVINGLTGILIFQFKGKHRNAIEHQNHIHTLFAVGGIIPLPVTFNFIMRP